MRSTSLCFYNSLSCFGLIRVMVIIWYDQVTTLLKYKESCFIMGKIGNDLSDQNHRVAWVCMNVCDGKVKVKRISVCCKHGLKIIHLIWEMKSAYMSNNIQLIGNWCWTRIKDKRKACKLLTNDSVINLSSVYNWDYDMKISCTLNDDSFIKYDVNMHII